MIQKLYNVCGPFMVESDGNFLSHYRCWLISDPDKKVLFEGSGREMRDYFEAICSSFEARTHLYASHS